MQPVPEDIKTLISDLEKFLSDVLKGENLSKKAKEKKDALLKKIKDVKSSYPQEFQEKCDSVDSDNYEDLENDTVSMTSERNDKDEESPYDAAHQSPPVSAQDLQSVFKAGYLEKRRKDHSFFGPEWQKRWCALSNHTFYYFGSDKDKQQKGEFAIDGYTVRMNNTLRKDSKKDWCFEIIAPEKRIYQFTAASQKDAEEWVEQIQFVLKDMASGIIPEDDDDEEGATYDDVALNEEPGAIEPIDEDIYEELPEEDLPNPPQKQPEKVSKPSVINLTVNKSTDYSNYYQGLWDCVGDQPDELSFKRGDAVYILSKEYQNFGWWIGEIKGSIGIVPKTYLMEMYTL
ncbi:src kinase-associated phosphoprotein 2 isoform X1 [Acipenser ruthenus]|uniref:src kinase-associated phosphoprotein 2 isoform X1 n=1 Tax=Acipenser ruthenus TaxID=7906 RepID=UPI00145BA3F9|nr:src kinase-associated phosphoprotein 2 isoform X1 [Acipenser ruthenus]